MCGVCVRTREQKKNVMIAIKYFLPAEQKKYSTHTKRNALSLIERDVFNLL